MRALIALALVGCAAKQLPGSLPGEVQGVASASVARVTGNTVADDGAPVATSGTLAVARYSAGGYWGLTRFGAITGLEVTAGLGYLSGDGAKHTYLDNEYGGVLEPWRFSSRVRLAGDFGIGYTLDDRYTYAGARLGLGLGASASLDGSFRRHFGDTPGNAAAHEDRARGVLTIHVKPTAGLQIGFDYIRGDQRSLAGGIEVARTDYLLRGRYEMFAVTIGYGAIAEHPKLEPISN